MQVTRISQPDRQTDSQTDRQTPDRQEIDRKTERRQTDIQAGRLTKLSSLRGLSKTFTDKGCLLFYLDIGDLLSMARLKKLQFCFCMLAYKSHSEG